MAGGVLWSRVQTPRIAQFAVTAEKLGNGTSESAWVMARIAGAAAGAIGTTATLGKFFDGATTNIINPGDTFAGSLLYWAGIGYDGTDQMVMTVSPVPVTGTWRAMGHSSTYSAGRAAVTTFVRIA